MVDCSLHRQEHSGTTLMCQRNIVTASEVLLWSMTLKILMLICMMLIMVGLDYNFRSADCN
jgi:hypothetical protein